MKPKPRRGKTSKKPVSKVKEETPPPEFWVSYNRQRRTARYTPAEELWRELGL